MSENKTLKNDWSVEDFLASLGDERKRADSEEILEMMRRITGEEPRMWGDSIIGFGSYHYRYGTGREGDWFITGFMPRKNSISIYLSYGFEEWDDLLNRLGTYRAGRSCLYINKLADVDTTVLRDLIRRTVEKGVRFR